MLKRRRRLPTAIQGWTFAIFILGTATARKTRLTWVNGIAHNLDHMQEGEQIISKFFAGKPIIFCHNPTAMAHDDDVRGYLSDLTQAGQQKLGRITAEVDNLVKHLKESVVAVGKRGCVVHIAHSQGALITYLAAKQLCESEMQQIEILAFGGAAALRKTPQTPFKRCINYYSVNDPLLMVVPSAENALRSGLVVGDDDEFCFLAPRAGDPLLDHNLWGPTYAQALQWEGDRFQRMYISPLWRSYRFLARPVAIILHAIAIRINTALKSLLQPILLSCFIIYRWSLELALRVKEFLARNLLRPLILILTFLVQSWRREDKYESVTSILNQEAN